MIRQLIVTTFLFVFSFCARAQVAEESPYVAVQGSATKTVVPDTFKIDISLSETSKDTAAMSSKIEELARSILQIAEKQGVPDVNVDVDQLTVEPDFDWNDEMTKRTYIGSTYSRELHVRFAELIDLQKFMAALPAGDTIQVTVGDFSYSNEKELRYSLLADAIADAKRTAGLLAEGAGRQLGEVHTISTRGFGLPYSRRFGGYGEITVSASTVTPLLDPMTVLKAGTMDVTQDVYIVFQLKD